MPRPRSVSPLGDRRYTVSPEYCGSPAPRIVARFCGDWLGHSASPDGALAIALAHAAVERSRRALAQAEADFGLAVTRGRGT